RIISSNREALQNNLQENFVTTVSNVSGQIGDYVAGYRKQVVDYAPKAFASLNAAPNAGAEPPALLKDPNILKVRILDPAGKGPFSQKSNFEDPKVPDLEFDAFQSALHGKSYVGQPYYDATDDLPILLLAEPLRDARDSVVGVLSVIINVKPLLRIISEQSSGGTRGTRVYVVDSKGNLILHPSVAMMQSHPSLEKSAIVRDYMNTGGRLPTVRLYEEEQDGKKVDVLGSYSSVADLGWGVIIQIEKEVAFASVSAMIRQSAMWGILFAVAAAIIGFFLARWITNPIQRLAQHALDVGRNQNFDKKITIHAGNEIEQLADTFNFMTDEIK